MHATACEDGSARAVGFPATDESARLEHDRGARSVAFSGNGRSFLATGDRGTLLAIAHLLLDRRRRVDRLELDPVDADLQLAARLVERAAQLVVDPVARRQGS